MSNSTIGNTGSVDDIKWSLHHGEGKIKKDEIIDSIIHEKKTRKRKTVIKMLDRFLKNHAI